MGTMDGRVVLVTGATGALGSAVCEVFAAEGAVVHGTYVKEPEAIALRTKLGDRVTLHSVDITNDDAVEKLFHRLGDRVDVLLHVAGGFAMGAIDETPPPLFDGQIALNLKSAFLFAHHSVKRMKARGHGRIVFVGSKSAIEAPGRQAAYVASKAGVLAMARSLAHELVGTGVTVNAVLPSTMDTAVNRAAMPKADFTKWVQPAAVARVMLFLASDAAAITSGAFVPVYGDS